MSKLGNAQSVSSNQNLFQNPANSNTLLQLKLFIYKIFNYKNRVDKKKVLCLLRVTISLFHLTELFVAVCELNFIERVFSHAFKQIAYISHIAY